MLRAALTSALHGPVPQATHWKTAWLLRFSGATCPQSEHRCDVYAAGTNSSRPRALCFNRATSSPQPWRFDPRLRPRFCATLVPGRSRLPRAERVIARTFKSSTRMVSNGRAKSVLVFSTQSRRRSGFPGPQPRNRQLRSRPPIRSASRPGQAPLQSPQPLDLTGTKARNAQQLPARQRNRYRHAAIHANHAAIPGPGTGSGMAAKARCHRPDRSRVTR